MRLTQIRDFLAIVECGSIRAAARKLGVAQPTLTKSGRSLEAELHVQLLARSVRGIVPTSSGRAFFARARVAQSELRKAEEEAAQLGGSSAGSVALGMGSVGVMLILPGAVARFRQQFPRARVRVVEGLAHLLVSAEREQLLKLVDNEHRAAIVHGGQACFQLAERIGAGGQIGHLELGFLRLQNRQQPSQHQ